MTIIVDPNFPFLTKHVAKHKPVGDYEYDDVYWDGVESGEIVSSFDDGEDQ